MAYARFGPESEVYIYWGDVIDGKDGYVCCGCYLEGHWSTIDADEMVQHLRKHEAAGHKVPDGLIADIESEKDNDRPHPRRW